MPHHPSSWEGESSQARASTQSPYGEAASRFHSEAYEHPHRHHKKDQPGETKPPHEFKDHYSSMPEVVKHRENLDHEAHAHLSKSDYEKFHHNMEKFEARVARRGLEPEKLEQFYDSVGKLMEHAAKSPVEHSSYKLLAQQVMWQAASPENIVQGNHGTCNLSTVEYRMYVREPQAVAKLVTEAATKGNFETRDGDRINLSWSSLRKDAEAAAPIGEGNRSYASQVFQVAAGNVFWQTHSRHQGFFDKEDSEGLPNYRKNGTELSYAAVRYVDGKPHGNDNGERVVYFDTHAGKQHPGRLEEKSLLSGSPEISVQQLTEIYNKIARTNDSDFVLVNTGKGHRYTPPEGGSGDGVAYFGDKNQMKEMLGNKNSEYPLIIFTTLTDGRSGNHVICITDHQVSKHAETVKYHNSWSRKHEIESASIDKIWEASKP